MLVLSKQLKNSAQNGYDSRVVAVSPGEKVIIIYNFSLPQISLQYSCARLTGLDSRGGVLLLGSTHFYVIEGVTISNHGDLVDMETSPEGYVEWQNSAQSYIYM